MIDNNLSMIAGKKLVRMNTLSEATGISRTTLSNLYRKKSKGISFSVLNKICSYLECSVGDILEYVEDIKKE